MRNMSWPVERFNYQLSIGTDDTGEAQQKKTTRIFCQYLKLLIGQRFSIRSHYLLHLRVTKHITVKKILLIASTDDLKITLNVANHVVQNEQIRTFDVAESVSGASVNGTVTLVRLCLGSSISAVQYQFLSTISTG